jgi:hypothetical protein
MDLCSYYECSVARNVKFFRILNLQNTSNIERKERAIQKEEERKYDDSQP